MRVGTLAALLAAVLLVAGCGGSSNNSSGGSPKSSTKSSKPSTTTKAPSATTTASTSSTSSTSGTQAAFASDANCLKLSGVGAKFAEAMASASGAKFNETAEAADFQALANAAPSAIRPDLQTIAQAFTTFATAFKKSGYEIGKTPTAAQTAALESAVAVFNQPKLKSAEVALQAWGKKNCDL
jgi:hypothetical protein